MAFRATAAAFAAGEMKRSLGGSLHVPSRRAACRPRIRTLTALGAARGHPARPIVSRSTTGGRHALGHRGVDAPRAPRRLSRRAPPPAANAVTIECRDPRRRPAEVMTRAPTRSSSRVRAVPASNRTIPRHSGPATTPPCRRPAAHGVRPAHSVAAVPPAAACRASARPRRSAVRSRRRAACDARRPQPSSTPSPTRPSRPRRTTRAHSGSWQSTWGKGSRPRPARATRRRAGSRFTPGRVQGERQDPRRHRRHRRRRPRHRRRCTMYGRRRQWW